MQCTMPLPSTENGCLTENHHPVGYAGGIEVRVCGFYSPPVEGCPLGRGGFHTKRGGKATIRRTFLLTIENRFH